MWMSFSACSLMAAVTAGASGRWRDRDPGRRSRGTGCRPRRSRRSRCPTRRRAGRRGSARAGDGRVAGEDLPGTRARELGDEMGDSRRVVGRLTKGPNGHVRIPDRKRRVLPAPLARLPQMLAPRPPLRSSPARHTPSRSTAGRDQRPPPVPGGRRRRRRSRRRDQREPIPGLGLHRTDGGQHVRHQRAAGQPALVGAGRERRAQARPASGTCWTGSGRPPGWTPGRPRGAGADGRAGPVTASRPAAAAARPRRGRRRARPGDPAPRARPAPRCSGELTLMAR